MAKAQDTKEKIVGFLRIKGPSFPVQIAKAVVENTIFVGAFLSELYEEREVLISHMKIGNSPLYLIPGHEPMLEKFIPYLESKEKEAVSLLKREGILEDNKQKPAIRVALRNLKDFAFPFESLGKLFWRYLTAEEPEKTEAIPEEETAQSKLEQPQPIKQAPKTMIQQAQSPPAPAVRPASSIASAAPQAVKTLPEFFRQEAGQETPKKQEQEIIQKITARKKSAKDRFMQEIREYLARKSILLGEVEKSDKDQIIAKINIGGEECLMTAVNKKRFTEQDLLKVYKRYWHLPMQFYVISKGGISKKTESMIKACKKLRTLDII